MGGSKGFNGKFYVQNTQADFTELVNKSLAEDRHYEDVAAVFFDANNDGFQDLYVVSGGGEAPEGLRFIKTDCT